MLQHVKLCVTVIHVSLCPRKYWTRNSPYAVLFFSCSTDPRLTQKEFSFYLFSCHQMFELKVLEWLGRTLRVTCVMEEWLTTETLHTVLHGKFFCTWSSPYELMKRSRFYPLWTAVIAWVIQPEEGLKLFKQWLFFSVASWHHEVVQMKPRIHPGSCLAVPEINFIVAPCVTEGCHLPRS